LEFLQTVNVQATNDVEIGRKVRAIKRIAAEPIENGQPPDGGDKPTAAPVPYFDIGEATGKPGETVGIPVEAGCLNPVTGYHIAGGVGLDSKVPGGGYGKFRAVGTTLGRYLAEYFESQGLSNHQDFFQFASWESHRALPEEWWESFIGFYSIAQKKHLPPVVIPSGTHLFTLQIEILPNTAPGEYELTCKDEYYYTHDRQRRRDLMQRSNAKWPT